MFLWGYITKHRNAHLSHHGPATRHNAGHPLKSMGNVFAKESRMYGKIIHPLLGLFHQGIAVKRPAQVLHLATHLFQSLIQGYRANGHGRIAQDPLPGFMNVGTGTQIHYGIGPPTDGVNGLFYFLRDVGAEGTVADVDGNKYMTIVSMYKSQKRNSHLI